MLYAVPFSSFAAKRLPKTTHVVWFSPTWSDNELLTTKHIAIKIWGWMNITPVLDPHTSLFRALFAPVPMHFWPALSVM